MAKRAAIVPVKGVAWVSQAFDRPILAMPDGVVFRKVTAVERHADEATLLSVARAKGFVVTRIGSHYAIHRRSTPIVHLFLMGK